MKVPRLTLVCRLYDLLSIVKESLPKPATDEKTP